MRHALTCARRPGTHLLTLALLCAATSAFAEEAPLGLTASDGTGLTLVSYQARAVVEPPLAFTELTLTFENPQNRVLEGQFRVTLPRGATVSRFAMKLDGRWQEGEMVEKQAARRAYEDFLHRRQDPALLEQAAGNEFSARVFPIPARGKKELIVSWSHELPPGHAPFTLPLKGLPQVGTLDVKLFSGGRAVASLAKTKFAPDKDFVGPPPAANATGLRAGNLVVARVTAVAASKPEAPASLLLLVDTSASRALGYGAQLKLVESLVGELAKKNGAMPLTVAAFDQSVAQLYDGPARGFGAAQVKALKDRRPLGASDVSGALAWALENGKKAKRARVVLVTDGVFTAGDVEGDQLLAAVARLKNAGVERLDAVGVGGIRDDGLLERLVTAKLPKTGAVLDGDSGAAEVARRLGEATVAKVAIDAPGAKLVWPSALEGVQAGDEAVVVVELASASAQPKLSVGGVAVNLSGLAGVERPLLERAWAQTRIASLMDRIDRAADGPKEKQKLKDEIVGISTKYRVLSPYTALLVLETEADYARFDIDRKALADILTVKDGRLALLHRGPETFVAKKPPPPPMKVPEKPKPAKEKKEVSRSYDFADDSVEGELANADEGGREEPKVADAEREMDGRPDVPAVQAPAAPAPPPPPPPATATPRPREEARPEPMAERSVSRDAAPARGAVAPGPGGGGMPEGKAPWEGPFKDVMVLLQKKDVSGALAKAAGWREEHADDVLALVALGEASEAKGDVERAARAYGSLIDLFPMRADMRRFAGERLDRLKAKEALALAADTYAKAAEQRADHPASHRLLAWALLRLGEYEKAFAAIEKGLAQRYPDGRFAGVVQILQEDAGLIAAAWAKAKPGAAMDIKNRLKKAGGREENAPSLRFVLTWETDANDVDFHIFDGKGNHAFYQAKQLASGGDLYADVTTGYGPECFTIRKAKPQRTFPYKLQAHYYSRGPMGYGMGKLEVIEHDGKGGLTSESRPFIVMVDQAFVDLGTVAK